jgi:endonuclease YncB( thermonuclease family)
MRLARGRSRRCWMTTSGRRPEPGTLPHRSRRPRRLRVWQAMALIGVVIAVAFWSRQGSTPETRQEAGEILHTLTGPVVSVVDGDTIDVQLDGRRVRVRYSGINTPATQHPTKGQEPCGPEAAAANRTLVEGQTVRLELDVQPQDRAQRLLAYVYVGDLMVNTALVRQGYAQVATSPLNVRYQDQFVAFQETAKEDKAGCWGKVW